MKIKKSYQLLEVMNSTVLIDTSDINSSIIKLNETSKDIIELLLKGKTKQEIIDCMVCSYDVDLNTISNDYDRLIDSLKKANVVDD